MEILVRPLRKADDRSQFHSGQPDLDLFFRRYAGQNQFRHHIGITYIATDEATIFGYATVASASIERETLPEEERLPVNYPLPALRLGRLAVDIKYQRLGIGKLLLRHVLMLALQQKELVGCVGVVADAKPDAIRFYYRYGFRTMSEVVEGELRGHPAFTSMFLPIKSISLPGSFITSG